MLVRDESNKAIINKNDEDYIRAKSNKNAKKILYDRIGNLENQVNQLKEIINQILEKQ